MIKKLLKSLQGYGKTSVLTSLFIAGETILEVLIPFLMLKIVDVGIAQGDLGYVLRTGGVMVAIVVGAFLFGVAGGRFAAVASTGFAKNIRQRLFYSIQNFSFANIDRFSSASLITRLTVDVTNTQMAFMMTIRVLVRAPMMLIASTAMAIYINASLAVVFLTAIPIFTVALIIIMKAAFPRFQKMLEKYDNMNGEVQEKLTAIRVIKAFVREDHESANFKIAANNLRKYQLKAERVVIFTMPIFMVVTYACLVAVMWFGGLQIINTTMAAGELFSFIGYTTQILMSLMMISMAFIMLVISRASIKRIVEIFDETPQIIGNDSPDAPKVTDGSIVFENVYFSYSKSSNKTILDDINIEIKSGETIGIIGGTGSGKTSLVQLIPRLYDVDSGSLKIGGNDVREYHLDELRNNVAMVLQENLLFAGSIKDNLKWGNPDARDEEIIAAAKTAQADDFIMQMPDGYDTLLNQAGVNISGGQKQRLCIARALLKRPKVIILDDSTSAVDTATDSRIRSSFKDEFSGVTTLIIAQRISSVIDANRIIVLDEGKISAIGTHEELLASSSIYADVYHSQEQGVG